jgi:predicted Zn-dependent protease
VLLAVCIVGTVVSVIVYRSEDRIAEAVSAVVSGSADPALLEKLDDAKTRLNPDSLRDNSRAIVLARNGRADEAERLMLDVVEREPENQLVWVTLARVQVTAGHEGAARRSYDRAVALNSQTPDVDLPPRLERGKP